MCLFPPTLYISAHWWISGGGIRSSETEQRRCDHLRHGGAKRSNREQQKITHADQKMSDHSHVFTIRSFSRHVPHFESLVPVFASIQPDLWHLWGFVKHFLTVRLCCRNPGGRIYHQNHAHLTCSSRLDSSVPAFFSVFHLLCLFLWELGRAFMQKIVADCHLVATLKKTSRLQMMSSLNCAINLKVNPVLSYSPLKDHAL